MARLAVATYGIFAFVQWAVTEFAPPWLAERIRLGNNLPKLSGWQWLVIGLGLLLLIGFEATARGMHETE